MDAARDWLHDYTVALVCKGRLLPFSPAERAARAATRDDGRGGVPGADLRALALAASSPSARADILAVLDGRLAAPRAHWRRAAKAMEVVRAIATHGSDDAAQDAARLAPSVSPWRYSDIEAAREAARGVYGLLTDHQALSDARGVAAGRRGAPPGWAAGDVAPPPERLAAYWRSGPLALPGPEGAGGGAPSPSPRAAAAAHLVAPATPPSPCTPRGAADAHLVAPAAPTAAPPPPPAVAARAAAAVPPPDLMSFDDGDAAPDAAVKPPATPETGPRAAPAASSPPPPPPATPETGPRAAHAASSPPPPPLPAAAAIIERPPTFVWHPPPPPPRPPTADAYAALLSAAVEGVRAAEPDVAPGVVTLRPGTGARPPPMRGA